MSTFAVILAAAGKSSRFKDKNFKKPFAGFLARVSKYISMRRVNRINRILNHSTNGLKRLTRLTFVKRLTVTDEGM